MAEGLAKAHQAGIVHRDLKPENIVISGDGYIKILLEESLGSAEYNHWQRRTVILDAWSGYTGQLTFDTQPSPSDTLDHSRARSTLLWGSPSVSTARRPNEKSRRPPVILISIDCLRADHVGTYGYARKSTPHIDSFARHATVFENVVATSSWTFPTHMSMFTGLPPSFNGATRSHKLSSSIACLPQLLASAGYSTEAVISGPYLTPEFGFHRGFQVFIDLYPLDLSKLREENRFLAERKTPRALDVLEETGGHQVFLFVHFIDAHWPYAAPPWSNISIRRSAVTRNLRARDARGKACPP